MDISSTLLGTGAIVAVVGYFLKSWLEYQTAVAERRQQACLLYAVNFVRANLPDDEQFRDLKRQASLDLAEDRIRLTLCASKRTVKALARLQQNIGTNFPVDVLADVIREMRRDSIGLAQYGGLSDEEIVRIVFDKASADQLLARQ